MKNSGLESRKCHQASERFLLPPLIFPQIQTSSRGRYTQSFEIFSLEIFVAFETDPDFSVEWFVYKLSVFGNVVPRFSLRGDG